MSLLPASPIRGRKRLGWALGLAVCLHLLGLTLAPAQVAAGTLFDPSPGAWEPASTPSVPFARVQVARLNAERAALLAQAAPGQPVRILLNLFSNEQFSVVLDQTSLAGPGRIVARGRVEGIEASQVVLSLSGEALAGSVFAPGRGIFQIQHAGGGLHRIAEMDRARMPRCGLDPRSSPVSTSDRPAGFLPAGEPAPGTNVVMDLLVVYTPLARAGAGGTNGMHALIDAAVAEANAAYENSQVNARLRLVHRAEVDYEETGDIAEDLDRMEEDDSEHPGIQDIHALRAQHGADLVCLITETTGGPLGLANLMREVEVKFSEHAFSIVQRQYANAYQVLAHELGHLMGCQHDRTNNVGPGAFSYSYARRFTLSNLTYHTVMAPQPGLPIPHFSNPEVSFLGEPTGVAQQFPNSANNAKTINLTADTVALFSSVLRTGTPPRLTLLSPTNGTFLYVPALLPFTVDVQDDDGDVEEVEFIVNGVEIAERHQPPFSLTWSNANPGTYAVRAQARDRSGWEARSATVVFTLEFPPPAFAPGGCARTEGGGFALRAVGLPGLDYAITFSEDLTNWLPLASGSFTNNLLDFIDTAATNAPRRFYRIERQP